MSLAEFGIKHKVFTLFSVFLLTVLGLVAFFKIPKLEDPYMIPRVIAVTTRFPGMSVARMSKLVAKPVEEQINRVPEVKYIVSTVSRGRVSTLVMIDDSIKKIKPFVQDLRNKLSDVILPQGCSKPRVDETEQDVSFATLAVTFKGASINQLDAVMTDLQRAFQVKFHGIRYAKIFGVPKKKFYIESDSYRLASYHLTVSELKRLLSASHVLASGGSIRTGVKNVMMVPGSEFRSLQDLKDLQIPLPGTQKHIKLSDIASVSVKEETPMKNRVFFNGQRVAILALYPVRNVNLISLGEAVKKFVTDLNKTLKQPATTKPAHFHIHYSTFRPAIIASSLHEFALNLYMAMFIVAISVIVCLTWRAGVLVGLTVPLSMLFTLLIMYYLQIPLERMTLAGLIISLGLLIDNGMVMVEDTRFAMDKGMDRVTAAKAISKKLAAPLLVSQLTTILAFAPPLLAANGASEYVGGMSKTILIVLLVSWFLSQWFLPLLCSLFLKPTPIDSVQTEEQIFSKPSFRFYKRILTLTLNHRLLTTLLVVFCFAASIWAMKFVKVDFMPKFATRQAYVRITMPSGAELSQVLKKAKKLQSYLLNKKLNPEVEHVTMYAGASGPMLTAMNKASADINEAYFLVKLKSLSDAQISALEARYRQYVLSHYSDVKVKVGRLLGLSSEPGKLQVNIIGPDPQALYRYGLTLEKALAKIPHTFAVRNSWGNLIPSLNLNLNRYALKQAGISAQQLVESVKKLISGSQVGELDHGLNLIPIEFRLSKNERVNMAGVQSISLYSPKLKRVVALRDLATVKLNYIIPRINTFQREKTIHVIGFNVGLGVRQALKQLQPAIEKLNLPNGYRIRIRGESEAQGEANEALFGTAAPCIALIFLILVYQFKSVRKMLILFLILPLALIGVVLGLIVTGVPFGFMPTFGVIALVGLVVNDGVILLDAIGLGRKKGMGIRQSLLTAAQQRLRPILLTTVTTVLGMLPLILNGGPMWEGLAVCFASGELVSTLMLLFMVPVLYSLFFRYWKKVQPPVSV